MAVQKPISGACVMRLPYFYRDDRQKAVYCVILVVMRSPVVTCRSFGRTPPWLSVTLIAGHVTGTCEPRYARLATLVADFVSPFKSLQIEMAPNTNLIANALTHLKPVFDRRYLPAATLRNEHFLNIINQPAQLPVPVTHPFAHINFIPMNDMIR